MGFDFRPEDIETGSREPALRVGAPGFGWKPIAFRVRNSRPFAEWAYFGRIAFTEPFFEDTIGFVLRNPFARAFRQETQLDRGTNPDPAGFIFHMSRCGSTLVAQMLAALPRNTVISEAPLIDDAIRTGRPDWLCFVISALCSGPTLRQARRLAHPQPSADPRRVPANALGLPLSRSGGGDGFANAPSRPAGAPRCSRSGRSFGLRAEDITGLRRDEWCARVLAGFCESAAKFRDDPNGLFIDYRELPDAVWTRIAPHFGVSFSREEVEMMRAAAKRDAKEPSRPFYAQNPEEHGQASPAVRSLLAGTTIARSMELFSRGSSAADLTLQSAAAWPRSFVRPRPSAADARPRGWSTIACLCRPGSSSASCRKLPSSWGTRLNAFRVCPGPRLSSFRPGSRSIPTGIPYM